MKDTETILDPFVNGLLELLSSSVDELIQCKRFAFALAILRNLETLSKHDGCPEQRRVGLRVIELRLQLAFARREFREACEVARMGIAAAFGADGRQYWYVADLLYAQLLAGDVTGATRTLTRHCHEALSTPRANREYVAAPLRAFERAHAHGIPLDDETHSSIRMLVEQFASEHYHNAVADVASTLEVAAMAAHRAIMADAS